MKPSDVEPCKNSWDSIEYPAIICESCMIGRVVGDIVFSAILPHRKPKTSLSRNMYSVWLILFKILLNDILRILYNRNIPLDFENMLRVINVGVKHKNVVLSFYKIGNIAPCISYAVYLGVPSISN